MRWTLFPWTGDGQDDSEDSTSEDEVIECDHEFEQETEQLAGVNYEEMIIEEGHLVVVQYELVAEHCTECGEPGFKGEAYESPSEYNSSLAPYEGQWTRRSRQLVFEPVFEMEPGLTVTDALTEPEEEDEEPGRVIVNQSDDVGFGVTD